MNFTPANIGKRLVATLLDLAFISTFVAIITLPFAFVSEEAYLGSISVFTAITIALYYAIFEGCATKASLGKLILNLRVVTSDGNRIGFGRGLVRGLVFNYLLIPDLIVGLATDNHRALHDIMTKSYVVVNGSAPAPTNNKATLICLSGVYAGNSYLVGNGIIIGTDPTVCQLVVPSANTGVSRNHCKVSFDATSNMFIIHDMGSTNGTFLENGQPVPQGIPYAVPSGTRFFLATPGTAFEVR